MSESRTGNGVVSTLLAALLGFFLAEMIILVFRAPGLLQPAHLGGFFSLLASAVVLYLVYGVLFAGFVLLMWLLSRVLRLRLTLRSLVVASLFCLPLFLVVQKALQDSMLGMYSTFRSPKFIVPTVLTLVLLGLVLVLIHFLTPRLPGLFRPLRRAFTWPGLIPTACVLFILANFAYGPSLNVLGVFPEDSQRAHHKESLPDPAAAARADAPSFIVVQIEALRSDHFTPENAPFLWELAQHNVYFTNYNTVASATRPSVTSFFTSLYPAQHGCYNLALTPKSHGGQVTTKVADTITSLPKGLQDHGYRTLMITSNTLAADLAFGCETVIQRFDAAEPYHFQFPTWESFAGFFFLRKNLEHFRVFKILAFAPKHSTNYFDAPRLNKVVKREMAKADERPFFLYVHYMEPHSPYYRHPYEPVQLNLYTPGQRGQILAAYAMEIRAVDEAIADLFAFLEEKSLLANTYVLITADHGEEFYDHRNWGHGKSLYPEATHVPALFVLPPDRQRAVRVETWVANIDVAPTIAELAGIPQPEFWEGESLLPWIETASEIGAVASTSSAANDVPPVFGQFDDGRHFWAYAISDGLEVIFRGRGEGRKIMLFNLAEDPLAQNDLYGRGVDREAELVTLLEETLERLDATAELFQAGEAEIDPEHLEQLRALGYVD